MLLVHLGREPRRGRRTATWTSPQIGNLGKLAASPYAPIGQFGRWLLVVRKNDNPKLDLADVTMIVIDFHGFFRAFDLDSQPDPS